MLLQPAAACPARAALARQPGPPSRGWRGAPGDPAPGEPPHPARWRLPRPPHPQLARVPRLARVPGAQLSARPWSAHETELLLGTLQPAVWRALLLDRRQAHPLPPRVGRAGRQQVRRTPQCRRRYKFLKDKVRSCTRPAARALRRADPPAP